MMSPWTSRILSTGVPSNRQLHSNLRCLVDEINRLLLESAADGIYAVDANGLTTFINSAAAKMTGWAPDELVGKPHHALIHYLSPGGGPALPRSSLPPARCGEDAVFLRKDGSSFPAAYTCTSVLRQEKLFGTVVVFRDNSEKQDQGKAGTEQERGAVGRCWPPSFVIDPADDRRFLSGTVPL